MAIYQVPYFGDRQADTSLRLRMDIDQLDKKDLANAMNQTLHDGTGLLEDFEFLEHSLQDLMNNQQFVLKSSYTHIAVTPNPCPKKHLSVMGSKFLESTEMWQPYYDSAAVSDEQRYYEPVEIIDMMERLQSDEKLTHFDQKRDPHGISGMNFPEKFNETSD